MKEGEESVNVHAPKSTTSIFEDAPPLFLPHVEKCLFPAMFYFHTRDLPGFALVLLGSNMYRCVKKTKGQ